MYNISNREKAWVKHIYNRTMSSVVLSISYNHMN